MGGHSHWRGASSHRPARTEPAQTRQQGDQTYRHPWRGPWLV